jgi:hypothetical protein
MNPAATARSSTGAAPVHPAQILTAPPGPDVSTAMVPVLEPTTSTRGAATGPPDEALTVPVTHEPASMDGEES